jgi:hypothetical protein
MRSPGVNKFRRLLWNIFQSAENVAAEEEKRVSFGHACIRTFAFWLSASRLGALTLSIPWALRGRVVKGSSASLTLGLFWYPFGASEKSTSGFVQLVGDTSAQWVGGHSAFILGMTSHGVLLRYDRHSN